MFYSKTLEWIQILSNLNYAITPMIVNKTRY